MNWFRSCSMAGICELTSTKFAQNAKRDGKDMGEALGFRLGRYTDAQLLAAGIPRDKAPWVWMATREDAAAGPVGMALGLLFRTFSRPRCGFTFLEQDLLKLAADGHTDESIAQLMKKSLPTTKKCFRTIYDKAEKATAGSQTFAFSAPPGGVRGWKRAGTCSST
ncbi:MAG: hypothetical protein M3T49_06775 [Candidatus Eremiobacteraeota bacterium]|nr:hypothetical protein [Candidatus Eremiobacteraeota bacterium]